MAAVRERVADGSDRGVARSTARSAAISPATTGVAEHGNYDARSAFGTDDRHRLWENGLGLSWENS